MSFGRALLTISALFSLSIAKQAASAEQARQELRPDEAKYLRVQVLLDRQHYSPGEIDAIAGDNTTRALRAFQRDHGISEADELGPMTIAALDPDPASPPTTIRYRLSADDAQVPTMKIPSNLMKQSKLPALGYQSPLEALGEKFHMSPRLLKRINQGKDFSHPDEEIQVPNIRQEVPPNAAKVVVSKTSLTVEALDASDKVIAVYPATIGSTRDPLPIGDWNVKHVTRNPVFYYNPDLFWNAPEEDAKARIKPGPNNPVGVVWIGLTKEHYGIHGTPEPSLVGHAQSHGCIRLTNWDAAELAQMVEAGTPVLLKE